MILLSPKIGYALSVKEFQKKSIGYFRLTKIGYFRLTLNGCFRLTLTAITFNSDLSVENRWVKMVSLVSVFVTIVLLSTWKTVINC